MKLEAPGLLCSQIHIIHNIVLILLISVAILLYQYIILYLATNTGISVTTSVIRTRFSCSELTFLLNVIYKFLAKKKKKKYLSHIFFNLNNNLKNNLN